MNNLDSALKEIKADSLLSAFVFDGQAQWGAFCEEHNALFERVSQNKPETAATYHLLGLLTKAHINAQTALEQQKESLEAMQKALSDNLGQQNAQRFENNTLSKLLFITHLWLYLQGYMKMDFSLANDHAEQTAKVISTLTGQDIQVLRVSLVESFYKGDEHSIIVRTTNPVLAWIKSLFQSS
ncbi:hypothetical protein [Vibrio atypicus]|uniref:hypothetical protein n=1 Tax=Vibrio atypicus TaxID=558271 RepID=UPI00135A89B7|nr:hypothetical protein [Vibrio atypicus]